MVNCQNAPESTGIKFNFHFQFHFTFVFRSYFNRKKKQYLNLCRILVFNRMELATNKEHFYNPNDVNLVIISFQIVKNQSCHMMPKYFAEHSRRGMAIISLRLVKVSNYLPPNFFRITCEHKIQMKRESNNTYTFTLPSPSKGQFIYK